MKPGYFVALCVALNFFACTEDKLALNQEVQSFTFQSYIVDYGTTHAEEYSLESEHLIVELPSAIAHELQANYKSGQLLNIETDDIHQFVNGSFDLSKVQLSKNLLAENRSGMRRVLGVIVNGPDKAALAEISDIERNLFSKEISSKSLESFYDLQSSGQIHFEGDVVEIDFPESIAGMNFLRVKCEDILNDLGYSYDDYDHVCFFTDDTNNYLGLASMNGKFSHVDESLSAYALTHEIGHNLGLRHASLITENGVRKEYGDKSDVMGSSYKELNGAHRLCMGWIEDSRVQEIHGSSASMEIVPLEFHTLDVDRTQVMTLKADEFDIVLSLRTDFNEFDQSLQSHYVNNIAVHRLLPTNQTELLKILSPGDSYTMEDVNKTVEYVSLQSDNSAILRIAK